MSKEIPLTPLPALGKLEAEVLRLVWQQGTMTAESVRNALERPLKESTVRTVLRRLEEKGYLRHETDGRTYLYSATAPVGDIAERGARGLADWLFDGSMGDLLVGLVGSSKLKREELDHLAKLIEQARREGP